MKRFIIFIYGIIAYLIFLPTFMYAIGFVGNIWVPKSIDSGISSGSTILSLLINSGLLSVFALQHSIMARPAFKRWWTKIIPKAAERSTYVLLASLALILIYWKWQPMTSVVWDLRDHSLISILLYSLFFLGWTVVLIATFMINHFDLFGLKQVYEHLTDRPDKPLKFTARYFYAFIRHPIMLGFFIAFWATPYMTAGHLLFSVMTTLYILVAVKYFEEKDLRNSLGQVYEEYQKKTPMFIPYKRKYRPSGKSKPTTIQTINE